jgi:hypothetical protein
MANEFKVRKGLVVNGSGSVILDVQGSQGQLFSVTDQLSGSLFSVNDISGVPVLEAFSDSTVKIGQYLSEAIVVSGSTARITGSIAMAGFSSGSVLFAGPGGSISQNNASFFWDNTNSRLGIGTNAPTTSAEIATSGARLRFNQTVGGSIFHGIEFATTGIVYGSLLGNQSTGEIRLTTAASYFPTFYSNGNEAMRISTARNLLIGFTSDTGERLQVSGSSRFVGDMVITGSGATSATYGLTIQNSNGVNTFRVRNDGPVFIEAVNTVATLYMSSNGDSSFSKSTSGTNGIVCYGPASANHTLSISSFNADNYSNGALSSLRFPGNFISSTGNTAFSYMLLNGTINQTGTSTSITRGLYINPTITSASDFRAIEWSNNAATAPSASWGLYGAGSAPNYINGNLTLGSTSNPINEKFVVWGDVRLGGSGNRVVIIDSYNNYIMANRLHFYGTSTNIRGIGAGNQGWILSKSTGLTDLYPSSIFAIDSTTQGFLVPRMAASQRTAIANPNQGLLVYDTSSATEGLWMYNSGSNPGWQEVLTNSGSQSISGSITANDITVTGTLTAQTIVAQTITSSILYSSGSNIFGNSSSNTQVFTGSIRITGSLTTIGSSLMSGSLLVTNVSTGYIIEARNNSGNSGGFRVVGNNVEVVGLNAIVGFVGSAGSLDLRGYTGGSTGNVTTPAATIADSFNYNASSANTSALRISPAINQTGTAGYTLLDLVPTINTTGSGISYYIKAPNFNVLSTGDTQILGSARITQALTASAAIISGSGTQRLTVVGSGSAQPLFTVQGSQGELFSIVDSLSGSLFSVNDQSGLPIMEVFSDNTILMGNYLDPMLLTTARTSSAAGINTLYTLPTSSYDAVYIDYTIRSGSNARAGNFMAMWSGTSVNFTDNSITEFGTTSGFVFGAHVSGSNMIVTGSSSTSGWTVKTIIKAI